MMTDVLMGSEGDPLSYQEAMESPEKEYLQESIQEEYEAIIRNEKFEEAYALSLADAQAPISANWVFKRKRKPDGSICDGHGRHGPSLGRAPGHSGCAVCR